MESRQYIFNNSTLTVKFGDILDTKAEVIVSSDDCYITMGSGVSRAILRAGGDIIIKDAQKMCPVPLGDVVVTTAGKMEKQKYVYHCITIDKKRRMQILARQVTEEDVLNYLLQHAVDKCFQLMQAMDLTSIAFPAIGAGAARIPIKKVIEQMSIAIAHNMCMYKQDTKCRVISIRLIQSIFRSRLHNAIRKPCGKGRIGGIPEESGYRRYGT